MKRTYIATLTDKDGPYSVRTRFGVKTRVRGKDTTFVRAEIELAGFRFLLKTGIEGAPVPYEFSISEPQQGVVINDRRYSYDEFELRLMKLSVEERKEIFAWFDDDQRKFARIISLLDSAFES